MTVTSKHCPLLFSMDEELLAAEHIDDAGSLSGFCLLDDGGSSDGSATGDCSDEDAVCLGARKVRASSEHETETSAAKHETSFCMGMSCPLPLPAMVPCRGPPVMQDSPLSVPLITPLPKALMTRCSVLPVLPVPLTDSISSSSLPCLQPRRIPDGLADAAAAEVEAVAVAAEDRLLDSILHRDLMPATSGSHSNDAMGCVGGSSALPPLASSDTAHDDATSEPIEASVAAAVDQGSPGSREAQAEAMQDPAVLNLDPDDMDLDLATRIQDLEEERDMLAERLLEAGVNDVWH